MKQLFTFLSQISLLLVFISSIKTAHAAVNYKLTSLVGRFKGNWSSWVDKRLAVFEMYVDWCNNSIGWFFPLDVNGTWNRGSIPLISWASIECGGKYQAGIMKLINNGTFDGYINQFNDRLKKWLADPDGIYETDDDRRAYLRLSWHHGYNMLSNKGLDPTRLQWIWSVLDVGQYTTEEYWVGENYTHWLGVDGYNCGASQSWSKWQSPNEDFDNMMGRLRKLSSTKPISINEFGTSSQRTRNISDIQSKTEWLNQVCDYLSNNSDIKMATHFNVDDGSADIWWYTR